DRTDVGNVVGFSAPGGKLGGGRFDKLSQLDKVVEKCRIKLAVGVPRNDVGIEEIPRLAEGHPRPGAPPRDDESLGGEYLERLADRLAADVEGVCELGFARQKGSFGELAGNDPASDLMGDPAMHSRGGIEAFVDQGSKKHRRGICGKVAS